MSKSFRLVLVALAAVFAFGALTAASASAVTFLLALWLWNGANVTVNLNVESEGELLLEDTKGGLFGEAMSVLCSGSLDGWVGAESLGEITDVLNLAKVLVSTAPLIEPGLECTNVSGCTTPLVWLVNLPWETEVELVEDAGTFFALLLLPHAGGNNPGWMVQCVGIIGEPEDECIFPELAAQLLLPTATTLGAEVSEAFRELLGTPLVSCTRGGVTGLVISDAEATVRHETGGELSASSETSEA